MDRTWLAISALQFVMTLTQFSREAYGEQAAYSKFAIGKNELVLKVPGRIAMLLIYVPAFVYCLFSFTLMPSASPYNRSCLVLVLLTAHFGKRVLETCFLHKYSGNSDVAIASCIGIYYALTCALITYFQGNVSKDIPSMIFVLGTSLFVVGQLGNLYHHWILAKLRTSKSEEKYVVPRGGLFHLVAVPHYLFELIAWLGIATVAGHLNGFLVFTSMCSYLFGRSVAHTRWNRAHIKGYPTDRRNIIPYIF
jgi:very-long-chain enoyl-CoA reductase